MTEYTGLKRVMMIGGPGTGKSTFAKVLASKTGLPLYHMDFYYHDPKYNFYNDKEAWHAHMTAIGEKSKWIIDGNSARTMNERMRRADTIFYFDLSPSAAVMGVVKRRFANLGKKRDEMPADWKEKITYKFLRYAWHYRKSTGQVYVSCLLVMLISKLSFSKLTARLMST